MLPGLLVEKKRRKGMVKSIIVRFIRSKVKGLQSAKFVGKGRVEFFEDKLVFSGKKMLPLWLQIVIFLGIGFLVAAIGFGPSGFLLAFLIDIFARIKKQVVLANSKIQEIIYDTGGKRFFLKGSVIEGSLICIGFQVVKDYEQILSALRQQFPNLLKEGKISGSATF